MTLEQITTILEELKLDDYSFLADVIKEKLIKEIYLRQFLDKIALRLDEFSGSELKVMIAVCLADSWPDTRQIMEITGQARKTVLAALKNKEVLEFINTFYDERTT
jgi:hypothetical protein